MSNNINYLIRVSYDGSNYYGSQLQPNYPTIEETMKNAFNKYFNMKVTLIISSRTDRGVHSLDHPMLLKVPLELDCDKTTRNLNWMLPNDIQINSMECVNRDFHPRYHSKEKTYRYKISKNINPFNSRYVTYYRNSLDIKKLYEIRDIIIGEHDFFNFTSRNKRDDYVRIVTNIEILKNDDVVEFYISGKGFLRFMVRNIIACFLDYNDNKISKNEVKQIVNREIEYNFKKADPNGLCLYKVYF